MHTELRTCDCAPFFAKLTKVSFLHLFGSFQPQFCPNAPETGFLLELCQYYLEYVNDLSLLIFFYLSQRKN